MHNDRYDLQNQTCIADISQPTSEKLHHQIITTLGSESTPLKGLIKQCEMFKRQKTQ